MNHRFQRDAQLLEVLLTGTVLWTTLLMRCVVSRDAPGLAAALALVLSLAGNNPASLSQYPCGLSAKTCSAVVDQDLGHRTLRILPVTLLLVVVGG